MTYNQALEWMFAKLPMYSRIGPAAYKPDLNNTYILCDLLGNPQDGFRSVHIAGTNGKGSVANMLSSILREKKLKTGLYTSPHLKDFRERIRINGNMIPKKEVAQFMTDHKEEFERIGLSFFEMTVGLAFDYFRNQKIDIGVIEVGLGGRLDSTNIITPLLSVITNISYDHMQLLGDTLEKIAFEKAGIIKPGIPVVVGETQPKTRDVFIEKARTTGSPIMFADNIYKAVPAISKRSGMMALDIYKNNDLFIQAVESPLEGLYQMKNLVTVVAACEALNDAGISITIDEIKRGIKNVIRNTGFAGRWQVLSRNPLTIADTGHNEGGLHEVLAQIQTIPHEKLHFVFGMVNDKAIGNILSMLPKDAIYYFCKADIPRGLDALELKSQAAEAGLTGESYPSVKQALKAARENASETDLVFVGGSTFVVAEVL